MPRWLFDAAVKGINVISTANSVTVRVPGIGGIVVRGRSILFGSIAITLRRGGS